MIMYFLSYIDFYKFLSISRFAFLFNFHRSLRSKIYVSPRISSLNSILSCTVQSLVFASNVHYEGKAHTPVYVTYFRINKNRSIDNVVVEGIYS